MRMNVGCVDGKTYISKEFTREELAEQIKELDGYIGTGENASLQVSSVDEALEYISSMFKYSERNDWQTASISTADHGDITINVRHVVWWSFTE